MYLSVFNGRHFTVAVLSLSLILSCKKDSNPVPSTPINVNLKTGLLLYLPFQGNFADSSGNGNQTTAINSATLTYDEHGFANNAFGATGNGAAILVTNNGSIKFDTAYSVSIEFMLRSTGGLQCLLSMTNYNSGYGPCFSLGTTAPGIPGFVFGANDSTSGCNFFGSAASVVTDTTSFIPQPESWYNAICIYHKGTVQVYINGQLVSTKTGTGTSANLCPNAQIVVGGWWSGGTESINGKIDEVRLYNRVLNGDEIAALAKDFQDNK